MLQIDLVSVVSPIPIVLVVDQSYPGVVVEILIRLVQDVTQRLKVLKFGSESEPIDLNYKTVKAKNNDGLHEDFVMC